MKGTFQVPAVGILAPPSVLLPEMEEEEEEEEEELLPQVEKEPARQRGSNWGKEEDWWLGDWQRQFGQYTIGLNPPSVTTNCTD